MKILTIAVLCLIGLDDPIDENQMEAAKALQAIADVQAHWKANDKDGNGKKDYWTGDVSGLYRVLRRNGEPTAYIFEDLAKADAAPVGEGVGVVKVAAPAKSPVPYHGYLFVALRVDEDGKPYRQDLNGDGAAWEHETKFAYCAYPAEYGKTGKLTFLIDEKGFLREADIGGKCVTEWPVGEAKKAWESPRSEEARAYIETLKAKIEEFKSAKGEYPKGLDELVAQGTIKEPVAKDPWGREYVYGSTGNEYVLFTFGKDGEFGGSSENGDINLPSMSGHARSNEKSAIGSIKMIREMSVIFRMEDCDRNAENDFWTGDVSGLYRILNAAGNSIAKIEIPLAMADAAPIAAAPGYVGALLTAKSPVPKAGYFFRAMTTDETGNAYNKNMMGDGKTVALNTSKFAFCAYPALYGKTGKMTYIVSQEGTVWKKDTGGKPVITWPAANPKTQGWGTID